MPTQQKQQQIAKAPSRWAAGKAQPLWGSPLAVSCTTGSEGRGPFHVNEFSGVLQHNQVLYEMKISVQTCLSTYCLGT